MSLLFVFDMDDVLYSYDWRKRMAGLVEITGLDFAQLRRRWWHDEGEWAAEAGRWPDGDAYLRALSDAFGVEVTREQWTQNRSGAMTLRPEAMAAVRRAKEFGRVSLLTNNGPLMGEALPTFASELVEVFGVDHLRTSSSYGARKPDPAVFERMLAQYDEPAEHVFFADDLPVNVKGAASVGITAHLFTTAADLMAAVEAFAEAHRSTAREAR